MKKHFAQKNKKLLCSLTRRREQIALVILLKRAKRAICSFKKSERVIHTKKQRPNYQPCFVSFELIFTCTLALITSLCLCWSKFHSFFPLIKSLCLVYSNLNFTRTFHWLLNSVSFNRKFTSFLSIDYLALSLLIESSHPFFPLIT